MIKAVTHHAWLRLQQRRGATHKQRVINKIKKWSANLPDDGIFYRQFFGYVVRGGY